VIVLAAAVAVFAVVSPRRLPQLNRETDQALLQRGPLVWALVNGYLLGTGLASRIGYGLFYVVLLGMVVVDSVNVAVVLGLTYGVARLGIAACLGIWMHVHPGQMADISRRLLLVRATIARFAAAATVVLSTALVLATGL
jgi:hypothetical protein